MVEPVLDPVFRHGIASGDPAQDRVVIWTRVSHAGDAAPVPVTWWLEDAEDPSRRRGEGTAEATAERDWTVLDRRRRSPAGPALSLWVRGVRRSDDRRPDADAAARRCRAHPARPRCPVPSSTPGSSMPSPGWPSATTSTRSSISAITSTRLRTRRRRARRRARTSAGRSIRCTNARRSRITAGGTRNTGSDPDIQAVHAAHPFIPTLDDHEFADGAWRDGARSTDEVRDGPWAERKAECVPGRVGMAPDPAAGPGRPEPRVPQRRASAARGPVPDRHPDAPRRAHRRRRRCATGSDGARSRAESDWLFDELDRSTATWRIARQPVGPGPDLERRRCPTPSRPRCVKVKLIDRRRRPAPTTTSGTATRPSATRSCGTSRERGHAERGPAQRRRPRRDGDRAARGPVTRDDPVRGRVRRRRASPRRTSTTRWAGRR